MNDSPDNSDGQSNTADAIPDLLIPAGVLFYTSQGRLRLTQSLRVTFIIQHGCFVANAPDLGLLTPGVGTTRVEAFANLLAILKSQGKLPTDHNTIPAEYAAHLQQKFQGLLVPVTDTDSGSAAKQEKASE